MAFPVYLFNQTRNKFTAQYKGSFVVFEPSSYLSVSSGDFAEAQALALRSSGTMAIMPTNPTSAYSPITVVQPDGPSPGGSGELLASNNVWTGTQTFNGAVTFGSDTTILGVIQQRYGDGAYGSSLLPGEGYFDTLNKLYYMGTEGGNVPINARVTPGSNGTGPTTENSRPGLAGGGSPLICQLTLGNGGNIVDTGYGGNGGDAGVINIVSGNGGNVPAGSTGGGGYGSSCGTALDITGSRGGDAGTTTGQGGYAGWNLGWLIQLYLPAGGNGGTSGNGGAGGSLNGAAISFVPGSGGDAYEERNGGYGGNIGFFLNVLGGNAAPGSQYAGGADGNSGGSINGAMNFKAGNAGSSLMAMGGLGGNIEGIFDISGGTGGDCGDTGAGGDGGVVQTFLFAKAGNGGSTASSGVGGAGGSTGKVYLNGGKGEDALGSTNGGAGGAGGFLDLSGGDGAAGLIGASGASLSLVGLGAQIMAGGGGIFSQIASVTVASTTAATTLIGTGVIPGVGAGAGPTTTTTPTIPALGMVPGALYKIKASGYCSTTGSPTAVLTLAVGAVNVLVSTATTPGASVTNKPWSFEGEITCRTVGASGTLFVQGQVILNGTVVPIVNTATAAADTTSPLGLNLKWTWSASSASNTTTCTNCFIQRIF